MENCWNFLKFRFRLYYLEKQYLRLTSLPDPATVRPEKILKQSLKMLLNKWKNA